MPNLPSTTSTRWQVAPSGGALPIPFGTPSVLASWELLQPEAPDWGLPSKHAFRSTVDETTGGKVQFVMTFDIDAPTPAHASQEAWCRMLCLFIVGHLSGKALSDACESLTDIYSWQIEQTRPIPQIPEPRRHAVSRVRQIERVPFAFDED